MPNPWQELVADLEFAFGEHEKFITALQVVVANIEATRIVDADRAARSLSDALAASTSLGEVLQRAADVLRREPLPGRMDGALLDVEPTLERLRQTVSSIVVQLEEREAKMPAERMIRLIAELRAGRVEPAFRARRLEPLRSATIMELQEVVDSEGAATETFPGPDHADASWMGWFWGHGDEQKDALIRSFEQALPTLAEWLAGISPDWWVGPTANGQDLTVISIHAESPPPAARTFEAIDVGAAPGSLRQDPTPDPDPGASTTDTPAELEPTRPETVEAAPPAQTVESSEGEVADAAPTAEYETDGAGKYGELGSDATLGDESPRGDDATSATAQLSADESPSTAEPGGVAAAPADKILTLDEPLPEIIPFETFVEDYWMSSVGEVERAPWSSPTFVALVVERQQAALEELDLATAWLAGAAVSTRGASAAAASWLVAWLDDFLSGGGVRSERTDQQIEGLLQRIRDADQDGTDIRREPELWLGTFMLAVSEPNRLSDALLARSWHRLQVAPAVVQLLDAWVFWQRLDDGAVAVIRRQLGATQRSKKHLQQDLEGALKELKSDYNNQHSAAHGRIQRTHCRAAWSKWIARVHDTLDAISRGEIPTSEQRDLVFSMDSIAQSIFDKNGAQFQDRNTMDRTVRELQKRAQAVIGAYDALMAADTRARAAASGARFDSDALALLRGDKTGQGFDGWILTALRAASGLLASEDPRQSSVNQMSPSLIADHPLAVEGWRGDFEIAADGAVAASPRRALEPTLAIARLLEPAKAEPVTDFERWLLGRLPDSLMQQDGLAPATLQALQELRIQRREELEALEPRLAEVRNNLSALADVEVQAAQDAIERLSTELKVTAGEEAEQHRAALLLDWLRLTVDRLEKRVELLQKNLVAQAVTEGRTDAEQAARLVKANRIDELQRAPHRGSSVDVRACAPRADAAKQWPDPLQALMAFANDTTLSDEAREFATQWFKASRQARNTNKSLPQDLGNAVREALLDYVFARTSSRRKGHFTKAQVPSVETERIREWLRDAVGNPHFFPQLRTFNHFSLGLPSLASTSRNLRGEVSAGVDAHELRTYLIPGLESAQRTLIRGDQVRGLPSGRSAVLDDLDACRLLGVAERTSRFANPLLGFLEIVAEQQRLSTFGPYVVEEGSRVRIEMFVGRRSEAERLAWHAQYDRVFSGRRLGKSALLRYIEQTPSMRRLPSGNELDVVFCTIAGADSEDAVAGIIVDALAAVTWIPHPSPGSRALGYLKDELRGHLESSPERSLLVLLDEADAFYREQTERAKSHGQDSLSWWMRTIESGLKDRQGVPRLRFVLCGYLYTDQNRGVWENKGDCLQLGPLEPHEAAELVAAPLARLGIDGRQQAENIAFRCGYQPAVIIRFGIELVERMAKAKSWQELECAEITSSDVSDVFQSNAIQSAIEETCWLNVLGREQAQLVLAGLLLQLREQPPGSFVEDPATMVLERIRQVEPRFEFDPDVWGAGTWEDAVLSHLRALESRSLVDGAKPRRNAFRLRFPHHLPVLTHRDIAGRVRSAITNLKTKSATDAPRWLLIGDTLSSISFDLSREAVDLGQRAVALVSQWQEPLLEPDQGLAHRVGIDRARIRTGDDALTALTATDEHLEPLLLLGGAAFARRAWQRLQSHTDIAFRSVGRLTTGQFRWWFKTRRGVEFSAPKGFEVLFRKTGGIPLLLGKLDQYLGEHYGAAPTIDRKQLADIEAAIAIWIGEYEAAIATPEDPLFLTPRERQLVHMIRQATAQYQDEFRDALRHDLVEFEGDGFDCFEPGADEQHIKTLLALGFLPQNPVNARSDTGLDSVAEIQADDPALLLCRLP